MPTTTHILAILTVSILAASILMHPTSLLFTNTPTTADQSLASIWSSILTDTRPAEWFSTFALLKLFFENMRISFDHASDWFPEGRKKYIHSQGLVAKIRWVPTTSVLPPHEQFTGLFSTGSDFGIIRASLAAKPTAKGMTPGVAVKMFRDARPSSNFMAMYSLDGQEGFEFLKNNFSNHLAKPEASLALKIVAKKFGEASKHITMVGLSDFARFGSDGTEVKSPRFPFRLVFIPNAQLQSKISAIAGSLNADTWRDQFNQIPNGSALYAVYAQKEPKDTENDLVHIADIHTSSDFTTSKVADSELFFQHVRFEDDLALRPDWVGQLEE